MDNNRIQATRIVLDETEVIQQDVKSHQVEEQDADRKHFGVLDMWSIRRGARTYKIHNRIPKL